MKIITVDNGEVIQGYPRADYKPVINPSDGVLFYYVEPYSESYNPDEYKLVDDGYIFTYEPHVDYPHLLKAVENKYLEKIPNSTIIARLNASVGAWLESEDHYPLWKQSRDTARYLRLDYFRRIRDLAEDEIAELVYINSINDWGVECRAERKKREVELTEEGIFPDLYTWPEMPIKQ